MDNGNFLPPATLATLFSFAAVTSVTPGPNNIMLAVSGVNFGIRRTLPQMAGITIGVLLIFIGTGLGLGFLFSHYPAVRRVLEVLGIAYTLWLAWKIASAGSLGGGDLPQPMRFSGSFAFQWVNPKLWLMAVATVSLYVRPGHTLADTAAVTATLGVINVPVMFLWAGFGAGLRDMLKLPGRIRLFNIAMGALLAASIIAFLRV